MQEKTGIGCAKPATRTCPTARQFVQNAIHQPLNDRFFEVPDWLSCMESVIVMNCEKIGNMQIKLGIDVDGAAFVDFDRLGAPFEHRVAKNEIGAGDYDHRRHVKQCRRVLAAVRFALALNGKTGITGFVDADHIKIGIAPRFCHRKDEIGFRGRRKGVNRAFDVLGRAQRRRRRQRHEDTKMLMASVPSCSSTQRMAWRQASHSEAVSAESSDGRKNGTSAP